MEVLTISTPTDSGPREGVALLNLRVDDNEASITNSVQFNDVGGETRLIAGPGGSEFTIAADQINIDGTTTFASGFDPSTKLDASDVGDLADYDTVQAAMEDETIIINGFISTSFLTADNIQTGTLNAGVATISAGDVTINEDGIEMLSGTGESNKLKWTNGAFLSVSTGGAARLHAPDDIFLDHGVGATVRVSSAIETSAGSQFWHESNDGSGSGLDADLLDGNHASDFASDSHNHDSDYHPLVLSPVTQTINIPDGTNPVDHRLVFTNGILTDYSVV